MSAINALTGSAGANSVKGSRFNDLSSEEFIKIIFTEHIVIVVIFLVLGGN